MRSLKPKFEALKKQLDADPQLAMIIITLAGSWLAIGFVIGVIVARG